LTTDLDNLIAETSAYLNILHPDYGRLAARVSVTKLHKETDESFLNVVKQLYYFIDSTGIHNFTSNFNIIGAKAALIADDVFKIVEEHHEKI